MQKNSSMHHIRQNIVKSRYNDSHKWNPGIKNGTLPRYSIPTVSLWIFSFRNFATDLSRIIGLSEVGSKQSHNYGSWLTMFSLIDVTICQFFLRRKPVYFYFR